MTAPKYPATFVTLPARGHMPFPGHRTCKQVREDEEKAAAAQQRPAPPPSSVRSNNDRNRDARCGSERLLEAIKRSAA